ncbi:hypothetical protein EBM89_05975 [Cellulomonas triticagri]|uniref:Uncharacterized protein n=1 Tax=Cellulomonas triticagri TaxID=2483352 RepID=A0A3M2JMJ2_9CELL|nr:hypothetical protein EBM89_05975 [Cellulomonas triticagri]
MGAVGFVKLCDGLLSGGFPALALAALRPISFLPRGRSSCVAQFEFTKHLREHGPDHRLAAVLP